MSKDNKSVPSPANLFKGTMLYSGAHYSLCPVEIRELWAQGYALPEGPQILRKIISELMGDDSAELVVISTCNRFDLCLFGNLKTKMVVDVFVQFAQWTLTQLPALKASADKHQSWLKDTGKWLRILNDEQALHHLFRVGSSLDSLVLGEPHILGQLKDAFSSAVMRGDCNQEATLTFNRAFQIAKKVRTETDLGKNGISIGHAAVEIVRRVFDNLADHKCLILGAGEMANITARHLNHCGAGSISVANRSIARAEQLAAQIKGCEGLNLVTGLAALDEYDVIIAATSSQEFILKKELHGEKLNRRRSGKPCVLVDISVPRNIDPKLGDLKNIFVFDVDDLDKVMESGRKAREESARKAEQIIQAELAEFISHRRQRENLVHVGKFHAHIKDIVGREIQKSLKSPDGMTEEQIVITAEAVAKKLVSHAALLVRTDARWDTEKDSIGEVLQYLFNLDRNERSQS
jgi:glutamyl-tRNA reductase